jgi:hypothetical protein
MGLAHLGGRRRGVARGVLALGCAFLLAWLVGACAVAQWKSSETAAGYVPPSQLYLVVKLGPEFDSAANDGGGIAALVDALNAELAEQGIGVTFAAPDESRAYPRLTLLIRASDAGNRVLSHFTPAGSPSISVASELTMAAGRAPSFRGEIEGTIVGASTTDSNTGAEKVGRAIARAVAKPN